MSVGRGQFRGVRRIVEQLLIRIGRRIPGLGFGSGEHGTLTEQSAHAIETEPRCRMQPAEGAHAGKAARQDVLEQAPHPFERRQPDRSVLAGLTLAIGPAHGVVGQKLDRAIAGGGFEHVTGEIAQGVLARTGRFTPDVPGPLPNCGRHLTWIWRKFSPRSSM